MAPLSASTFKPSGAWVSFSPAVACSVTSGLLPSLATALTGTVSLTLSAAMVTFSPDWTLAGSPASLAAVVSSGVHAPLSPLV